MLHKIQTHDTISNYDDKIKKLKQKKYSDKDISVILSSLFDVNKNEVYGYLQNNKI